MNTLIEMDEMRLAKKCAVLVAVSSAMFLTACTEGLGEEDATVDLTSSGNSCNLKELINNADREAANACGIQASSQIANADVYYTAAVNACKSGETGKDPSTGRVTTYKDTYAVYEKAANYALTVVDQLGCGSNSSGGNNGGFTQPETNPTQYNLCVGYIENGTKALASCYGPVKQYDYSCGDSRINYLKTFSSSSACITERDDWLSKAFG